MNIFCPAVADIITGLTNFTNDQEAGEDYILGGDKAKKNEIKWQVII
jgi:hypothetical protein